MLSNYFYKNSITDLKTKPSFFSKKKLKNHGNLTIENN